MSNPQKENGYVPIANELYEQIIKVDLLGSELRVLLFFIRKTYGYNKKSDRISLTQFEAGTGISRPTVVKALKNLILRNMLVKTALLVYTLNKQYETWVVNTPLLVKHKRVASKGVFTSIGKAVLTKTSKDGLTHKRQKTIKDNIQKTSKTPTEFLQGEQWNNLIDPFEKINPMYKSFYKMKTERHALSDMAKEIGYEKLKWLIENLKGIVSKPYAPKVSKPTELRRDLGKVIIFLQQEKNKNIKNKPTVGKI